MDATSRAPAPPTRPRVGLDDTHPAIRRMMIEGYRKMTPEEKLRQVVQLSQGVQQMALMGIRARHPDASEHEVKMRLAALWVDPETMRKAFGWTPEAAG